MDKITGFLEVGLNDADEIVVNHPDLKPDENGVGHIVFSPSQARHLGRLLLKHADQSENEQCKKADDARRKDAEAIPVDKSARVLLNGQPESAMPDYRETDASGMQKSYVVLSPEERAKGFVRPVRRSYKHKNCGAVTTMGLALAETYARDPSFYGGTFCATCSTHFPLDQFVWEGSDQVLMNVNIISAECGHRMHAACTYEDCACTCHEPDYDDCSSDGGEGPEFDDRREEL